jgi:hypothetical protein
MGTASGSKSDINTTLKSAENTKTQKGVGAWPGTCIPLNGLAVLRLRMLWATGKAR